jgi:hypothetical protein
VILASLVKDLSLGRFYSCESLETLSFDRLTQIQRIEAKALEMFSFDQSEHFRLG